MQVKREGQDLIGGLKKSKQVAEEKAKKEIEKGSQFKWVEYDWANTKTGEFLTGWIPSKELEKIHFEDLKTKEKISCLEHQKRLVILKRTATIQTVAYSIR